MSKIIKLMVLYFPFRSDVLLILRTQCMPHDANTLQLTAINHCVMKLLYEFIGEQIDHDTHKVWQIFTQKSPGLNPQKQQLIHFTLKLAIVFVVIGLFYCAVCFFNFPNFFSACLADHL